MTEPQESATRQGNDTVQAKEIHVKEKEFTIIDYLQKNPSLLIACVSGLVAAFSIVFNFIAIRINISYLAYWNIDGAYAFGSNAVLLHSLICSLLCVLLFFVLHSLMIGLSEIYKENRWIIAMNNYLKREQRAIDKEEKKLKSKQRKLQRKLDLILEEANEAIIESVEVEKMSREIYEMINCPNRVLRSSAPFEKIARRCSLQFLRLSIVALVTAFPISLCALSLITRYSARGSHIQAIVFSGIITIVYYIMYFGRATYQTRITNKNIDKFDIDSQTQKNDTEKSESLLLALFSKNGIKQILSDDNLKTMLLQLLAILIALLGSSFFLGPFDAMNKKEFPVYMTENDSYAIIHIVDDKYIMKEAQIQGSIITINLSKQRVLVSDDISYEIRTFQTVSRVETGGDIP